MSALAYCLSDVHRLLLVQQMQGNGQVPESRVNEIIRYLGGDKLVILGSFLQQLHGYFQHDHDLSVICYPLFGILEVTVHIHAIYVYCLSKSTCHSEIPHLHHDPY